MNKNSELLSSNELFFLLIGCVIAMAINNLPSSVVAISKQDAWISTILGGIYPLYIVLVGMIIIKKYPNSNIMNLSKAFLGKYLGNFLNLLFMLQFLFYSGVVISESSNQLRAYSLYFVPNLKLVLIFIIVALYASIKGLKTLARFTVITFFLLLIVITPSLITFKTSNMLNLKPFFEINIKKVISGSIECSLAYSNMELLLVIYPYVNNKKNIFKASLTSVFVIIFLYTWIVFTSIHFSGPDLVVKQLWPFAFVAESFRIPLINNFRFVDIFIWIIQAFKTVFIEYYMATKIFNNITKINRKILCFCLLPFIFVPALFMENELTRRGVLGKPLYLVTIFNVSYITLIALLTILVPKKEGELINEKI